MQKEEIWMLSIYSRQRAGAGRRTAYTYKQFTWTKDTNSTKKFSWKQAHSTKRPRWVCVCKCERETNGLNASQQYHWRTAWRAIFGWRRRRKHSLKYVLNAENVFVSTEKNRELMLIYDVAARQQFAIVFAVAALSPLPNEVTMCERRRCESIKNRHTLWQRWRRTRCFVDSKHCLMQVGALPHVKLKKIF